MSANITREQAVIMLERTYLREFEIEGNVLMSYLGNSVDVVISNGVINIGESVFHGNSFIKTVMIPQSTVDTGYYSFRMMENLEHGIKVMYE